MIQSPEIFREKTAESRNYVADAASGPTGAPFSKSAAAFPSEPPPDENCAHQLANYLAHDPPARLTDPAGSGHRRRPAQGGG